MDFGLRGKSALILGASKGLGFAVAKELAAEGAKIAIFFRGRRCAGLNSAGSNRVDRNPFRSDFQRQRMGRPDHAGSRVCGRSRIRHRSIPRPIPELPPVPITTLSSNRISPALPNARLLHET